jgi:hypothetical protein
LERRLGELRRGTHALLLHRDPATARRVAGRFVADGLRAGEAVVLSAEAAEIERLTATLTGQGVDVEGEHGNNHLLLLHSDEEQVSRLAANLEYLLGWIEDQVKTRDVRIWNHWAGALAERGRWHEALSLEAAIGDLHGSATVLCQHEGTPRDGDLGAGRLDGLATLHDAILAAGASPLPRPEVAAPIP